MKTRIGPKSRSTKELCDATPKSVRNFSNKAARSLSQLTPGERENRGRLKGKRGQPVSQKFRA